MSAVVIFPTNLSANEVINGFEIFPERQKEFLSLIWRNIIGYGEFFLKLKSLEDEI